MTVEDVNAEQTLKLAAAESRMWRYQDDGDDDCKYTEYFKEHYKLFKNRYLSHKRVNSCSPSLIVYRYLTRFLSRPICVHDYSEK